MSSTWVVVADSGHARIFEVGRSRDELREIGDLINPSARMREQELSSDDGGRSYDSFGDGRHAMENKTSAKEQTTIDFAGRLNEQLLSGLDTQSYGKLILIAAPDFLGVLRGKLDQRVRDTISEEINKNLTQHAVSDIVEHLPEHP